MQEGSCTLICMRLPKQEYFYFKDSAFPLHPTLFRSRVISKKTHSCNIGTVPIWNGTWMYGTVPCVRYNTATQQTNTRVERAKSTTIDRPFGNSYTP